MKFSPKMIIFDLDDTLVASRIAYDGAMNHLGIDPQDAFFLKARQQVKNQLPLGNPSSHSRFLYFKTYLELKKKYTVQKHLQLAIAYEDYVLDHMQKQWDELGRDSLFQSLKSKNYFIAILTNEMCQFQIKKLAIFEKSSSYFDFILTSEEVGVEKPALVLFQKILNQFSISVGQALMIGDSYQNDIEPCIKLKIPCLHSQEFLKSEKLHFYKILTLNELQNYLD